MTLGANVSQLYVFLLFFVLGVAVTAIYLVGFKLTECSRAATLVFDALYGCGCAAFVWYVNLVKNNGEARAFVFVGLILGALTAVKVLKGVLFNVAKWLKRLCRKMKHGCRSAPHDTVD